LLATCRHRGTLSASPISGLHFWPTVTCVDGCRCALNETICNGVSSQEELEWGGGRVGPGSLVNSLECTIPCIVCRSFKYGVFRHESV
jgi:hypothetical protein